MGPSQVSFLLLTIIACSYAMLPNQGFFGAGGSTSGMAGMTGSMSGMSGSMAGMSGSMAGSMGGAMGGARTGGMMALQYQMYDRKRSIMKNLIQLYERHGCIDPMQKFSSEFIPAAITMISGCADSRANFSCRAYGMQKLNFQTVMMQRAMPPQQIDMFAARFNQMSPYNSLQNTLLAQGPLNPLALRFAYGNEGPGSGPAFAGEQLDRIRNMRIAYLPYQCQGIKAWNLEMGLCCPGPGSNTASSTASASSSSNTFPNPALFSALQNQNQMSGQGSMQMNQRSSQWPSSNQNNFNTMNRFQTQNPMSYRNPFASQQQYNMRQSYPQNMFRQNSWQYGRQNAQPTYFGQQQQQQQQNPWNTFGTQTAAQSRWGQNNIFSSPFNAFTRMRQISTTSQQNQRQQMPMNPFQALGQMRISEQVNNKLISYYKNNYGCVEGIEYVPQMYRPAAISQFATGCGPRANMTCQMTTMRRNPRTQLTYRVMPQSTKDMYEEIINSLDIFTAVDMMRKNGQAVPQSMLTAMSTGGRTTGATANPMMGGASGLLASLTSGGAGASAGMNMGAGASAGMNMGAGAGAGMGMGAGAGAGMGMGTGASSMAGMGGGSMMGSLGGTLMDLQKIRLTRELAGMELSEAREAIFPFTCSEVGTAVKMGMCCPGAVDLSPQTQMQMMFANTVA